MKISFESLLVGSKKDGHPEKTEGVRYLLGSWAGAAALPPAPGGPLIEPLKPSERHSLFASVLRHTCTMLPELLEILEHIRKEIWHRDDKFAACAFTVANLTNLHF
jgi:hypothetical protein